MVSWRSASDEGSGRFEVGGDVDGRLREGVVVADAQRGQVRIQPAVEGGMVRGPRVGGEQPPGLGGARAGDKTLSEVGLGGQPGAREIFSPKLGRRSQRHAGSERPPTGRGQVGWS